MDVHVLNCLTVDSGGRSARLADWARDVALQIADEPRPADLVEAHAQPEALRLWAVRGGLTADEASRAPPPRPAERLSGQPYTLPEDAVEWIEALIALRREAVTNPKIAPFREHIARACDKTAQALRAELLELPETPVRGEA
ncbi:hypothetical protein ACFY5F_29505 [Streptomyces sp. NPDC013161]|uniref:hypothetical protein n=1 Tax=Streptomyces sp. NPDC013161 TaxID=3364862 RepID=UPI0036B7735B